MWWQWLAVPALLLVALVGGRRWARSPLACCSGWRGERRRRGTIACRPRLSAADAALGDVSPAPAAPARAPAGSLRLPRAILSGSPPSRSSGRVRSIDVWIRFLLERPWAVREPLRPLAARGQQQRGQVRGRDRHRRDTRGLRLSVATVLAGLGIGGIAVVRSAEDRGRPGCHARGVLRDIAEWRGSADRPPRGSPAPRQHLDGRPPRGAGPHEPEPQARARARGLRPGRQERQAQPLPLPGRVRFRREGSGDADARRRGLRARARRRGDAPRPGAPPLGKPQRRGASRS